MPKKFPPLTQAEVIKILKTNKFQCIKGKGDHKNWIGYIRDKKRKVTVDNIKEFDKKLLQSMIRGNGIFFDNLLKLIILIYNINNI